MPQTKQHQSQPIPHQLPDTSHFIPSTHTTASMCPHKLRSQAKNAALAPHLPGIVKHITTETNASHPHQAPRQERHTPRTVRCPTHGITRHLACCLRALNDDTSTDRSAKTAHLLPHTDLGSERLVPQAQRIPRTHTPQARIMPIRTIYPQRTASCAANPISYPGHAICTNAANPTKILPKAGVKIQSAAC